MKRFATMAAIPAALLVGVTALAASGMTALPVGIGMTAIAAEPVQTGQDAFGDWHDDAPGVKRLFKAEDMSNKKRHRMARTRYPGPTRPSRTCRKGSRPK
jgi:hypothetical protein